MTAERRIGIMGGTFDPIHIGHLAAASEAMGVLGLEQVIFTPAIPSHKPGREITDGEHRYNMVQLAVAENPRFTVSRTDLDRGKPTYTIDTLTDLRRELGDDVELYFITGADIVADIPNWSRGDELLETAHFVGVSRSGHTLNLTGLPAEKVHEVQLPAIAMSSTEVRERLVADRPVWYWLPAGVIGYIGKHHLYGTSWGYGGRQG